MLFNSLDFALFLPITFLLYWFVFNRNLGVQNLFLVVASYIFYGWWSQKFLVLIFISSVIDYTVAVLLGKIEDQGKRKMLLTLSLVANLGMLAYFKYANFFIDSFIDAFSLFGVPFEERSLNIVLPVGISFYTFQTLSYTIDVYRNKLRPANNIVSFLAYVAFFPQLVAGPIERATNLLPQFFNRRQFSYSQSVDGLRQILWGLFKKVVIADNCAAYANDIFTNYTEYSGSTLLLGAVFFAFQIYGDFSGYSDIAIGTARLFGFTLMQNFAFPYFSRDIAEFWRRWHISLSTWFRDYLYIPLGGSKGKRWNKVRNTFIVFVVSGFWHGANWTFIAWGAFNALLFMPLLLMESNRRNLDTVASGKTLPNLKDILMITGTFLLTCFAWIFFRAENMTHALSIFGEIFSLSLFTLPQAYSWLLLFGIAALLFIEWMSREKRHALEDWPLVIKNQILRYSSYFIISLVIFMFFGEKHTFIYFQF